VLCGGSVGLELRPGGLEADGRGGEAPGHARQRPVAQPVAEQGRDRTALQQPRGELAPEDVYVEIRDARRGADQ